MNVLQIMHVEDCFDGSYIKSYELDTPIDRKFILYLGEWGELDYYESFPKPFFKLDIAHRCIIQGVQGAAYLRVIFYRNSPEDSISWLTNQIESYGIQDTKPNT